MDEALRRIAPGKIPPPLPSAGKRGFGGPATILRPFHCSRFSLPAIFIDPIRPWLDQP
ncbi:hypothetical protein [Roseiconus lacunae]|uniref:hypothetical protein n=1 Tax=Roseiconus lacunae TaxID=2605694 RepID=UPI0013DCD2C1